MLMTRAQGIYLKLTALSLPPLSRSASKTPVQEVTPFQTSCLFALIGVIILRATTHSASWPTWGRLTKPGAYLPSDWRRKIWAMGDFYQIFSTLLEPELSPAQMLAVMILVIFNSLMFILTNFIFLFTEEIGFTPETLIQLPNALLCHGVISDADYRAALEDPTQNEEEEKRLKEGRRDGQQNGRNQEDTHPDGNPPGPSSSSPPPPPPTPDIREDPDEDQMDPRTPLPGHYLDHPFGSAKNMSSLVPSSNPFENGFYTKDVIVKV